MATQEEYAKVAELASQYAVFFRAHSETGITMEAMQSHRSWDGYDGETGDPIFCDGLAAADEIGFEFGGAWGAAEEILVLRGRRISCLYDGVVIYPTEIVARWTCEEYREFVASI